MSKSKVMQIRVEDDLKPLVRESAKKSSRSVPKEVNHRLRDSYTEIANLGEWMKGANAVFTPIVPEKLKNK